MKNENYLTNLLKAEIILQDYALAYGDEETQKIFIDLLDKYVMFLNDPTITALFIKLSSTDNLEEKELYTQILVDILEDRKKEAA